MASFVPASGFNAVVFDMGTLNTRAGFAGEELPRVVCASAAGQFSDANGAKYSVVEMDRLGWAQPSMEVRKLYSVRTGTDETVMRRLIEHGFSRLNAAPSEHPTLMSEPAAASSAARRHLAELLFEDFGVPALCVSRSPELSAISAGRSTALVLELGGGFTSAVAVIDGAMQPHTLQQSKMTTAAISRIFCKQLADKGVAFEPACMQSHHSPTPLGTASSLAEATATRGPYARPSAPPSALPSAPCAASASESTSASGVHYSESLRHFRSEELKHEVFEALARVQEPPNSASRATNAPGEYSLPDGQTISVGPERCHAAERFFKECPPRHAEELQPLQVLMLNAACSSDFAGHKELRRNVVISGGGACLPGLSDRLSAEFANAAQRLSSYPSISSQAHRIFIHNTTPTERRHAVWVGGSILASMGSHHHIWMSRAEYDEHGASLIARKGMQYTW